MLAQWQERCSLLVRGEGKSLTNSSVELEGLRVPLIKNRYGKGRVRVMRIHRDGERHEVSQLSLKVMIEGDFAPAYTDADNSTSISTDTVKNVVNVVARQNTGLSTEEFCQILAKKYLDTYSQVASVAVTAHETKWNRLSFAGKPHPHSFVLDGNGKPTVEVTATRERSTLTSGIDGFTFMKSTQSGWERFVKDPYTTLPETNDRMCATSMVASWKWSAKPANYPTTNEKILATLLEVFGTTYSWSVQDSLYRMGEAVLAAVPEIFEISMACPNMHFIPLNLSAFGLDNHNDVFLPTDEPHGQIECTVGRG
jgi:urate oxidase